MEIPTETDQKDLPAPHGIHLNHEGGWTVAIRWEYGYRFSEVDRFDIHRRPDGTDDWTLIATSIPADERIHFDILPDTRSYTYRVTAVSHTGEQASSESSQEPSATQGTAAPRQWISADTHTTRPARIHKPLPSTPERVFIAWERHPHATGYLLQALDETGTPYCAVPVPDPDAPLALITGPHPASRFTARVIVLRRSPDGTEYEASYADQPIELDNATPAHLAVVTYRTEEPPTGGPAHSYGAVVGLAYGNTPPPIVIEGIPYNAWVSQGHHHIAVVNFATPLSRGINALLHTTIPAQTTSLTHPT